MRFKIPPLPIAKGIRFFSAKHPVNQNSKALTNATSIFNFDNVNSKLMHSSSRSFSKLNEPSIEGSYILSLWSCFAILTGEPWEKSSIREVHISVKLSEDKKGYLIECARGTTLLNDHMQYTIPEKVIPHKIVSKTSIYVDKEHNWKLYRFLEDNRSHNTLAQEKSSCEKSYMPGRGR